MENNQNLYEIEKKQKRNEKIFNTTGRIVLIIILLFLIDFTYVFLFKAKPIITIKKTDEKYSSILYDVYICDNEKVIKFKTQKYNCEIEEQKPEINNSNNSSNNNNLNQDNNQNNNEQNTNNPNNENLNDKNANQENSQSSKDKLENDNITSDNNTIIEKFPSNNENNKGIKIVDKSTENCAQAIEYYYEDSNYKYYFTCIKSNNIYVIVNGNEYTLKYALNNKIVTIDELINAGFKPLKQAKNNEKY